MTGRRSDAERNREKILVAARGLDGSALRLNEVAHEAGVGVGTVYRHFPTVHALQEALSERTLLRLRDLARQAAGIPDAGEALAAFLGWALALQLEDGGLKTVLVSLADEDTEVTAVKREILESFGAVFDRARATGAVRPELTVGHLQNLVCGIEAAVRLGSPADRELLLDVLVSGVRPA
ncbi:MAG: TetR family transcriptional regulator [Microbacterium sp. 14-71-5]|nr:MAG: TetR family transcriptional regulator [Microbacterium sp. 14-71-5]